MFVGGVYGPEGCRAAGGSYGFIGASGAGTNADVAGGAYGKYEFGAECWVVWGGAYEFVGVYELGVYVFEVVGAYDVADWAVLAGVAETLSAGSSYK